MSTTAQDKGWCLVEVMGHRQVAGYVSDDGGLHKVQVFITDPDITDAPPSTVEPVSVQWYGNGALRAILYEHAERSHDPASSGGDIIGGSRHGRGDTLIDTRGAVVLSDISVSLVDTKRDEGAAMALLLGGRINLTNRRARQLYLFGADGAAGIVTQIFELAGREAGPFAAEFSARVTDRTRQVPS